ncbi:MAG: FAD-binding protein [Bacillota bacterium]|nr:FAD-binding protein [Bacillota bacterium]
MEINNSNSIHTDVLCIGGGGAGITAAISARKQGAHVTLVSKGKIGNSGNTIMIGGSYSMDGESAKNYGFQKANASFNKDYLFEQIVKQSFFLSEQNLVQQYVDESPDVVYQCYQWGEQAKIKQNFFAPGGWMLSGHALGKALLQGLHETSGIETVEDTVIVDLLKSDDKISGAVGFDVYTGEPVHIHAKSVVMGTGGFQPFSVTSTNSDMIAGDGIAMAYRAGAQLADMEFMIFIPTALEPQSSKGSILPFLLYSSGIPIGTLDGEGNAIKIPKPMRKMAKGSELDKVIFNYYWSARLAQGKGTENSGLYMDFSKLAKLPGFIFNFGFKELLKYFKDFYKYGYYHSDDLFYFKKLMLEKKKMEFALCSEYSMGGIVIDEKMATRVRGLFAAGEAGSGVFGACRVADATTEMMVQGTRAGISAAEYAQKAEQPKTDEQQVNAILNKIQAPIFRAEGVNPVATIQKIHRAADQGFGSIRNEEELTAALAEIEHIKEVDLPHLCAQCKSPSYNYERLCALQAENMLTCTEAGIRAALMRRESRGFHLRSDYPQVDNDRFAVRILEEQGPDHMLMSERKPSVTRIPTPSGNEENVPEFMLRQKLKFKNASIR